MKTVRFLWKLTESVFASEHTLGHMREYHLEMSVSNISVMKVPIWTDSPNAMLIKGYKGPE